MWAVRDEMNQNRRFLKHSDDSLTHYGVKGMKWGVRKEYEPKNPRKPSDKMSSFSDYLKKRDETISTKYGNMTVNHYDYGDLKKNKKTVDYIRDEHDPGRYASLEDAQKALDNLPKQTRWKSRNGQILATNHDGNGVNRLIDCFECSMAYEMRQRGYDVQAKAMPGGYSVEPIHAFAVKDVFEITLPVSTSNRESLAKECYEQMKE